MTEELADPRYAIADSRCLFMLTIPVLLGEMWLLKGIGNRASRIGEL